MPQELQDEARSSQGKMDKGIQSSPWEGCFGRLGFQFERKRNRPERYDRNVTQSTLRAMKKVEEVRVRRAERFYENRMKGKEDRDRRANKRELEQQIHLVRAPGAISSDDTLESLQNKKLKVKVAANPVTQVDEGYD